MKPVTSKHICFDREFENYLDSVKWLVVMYTNHQPRDHGKKTQEGQ